MMQEKYHKLVEAALEAGVNGAAVFLVVLALRYQGGTGFTEAVQLAMPLAVLRFVSYLKEETEWITVPQLGGSRTGTGERKGGLRFGKFV